MQQQEQQQQQDGDNEAWQEDGGKEGSQDQSAEGMRRLHLKTVPKAPKAGAPGGPPPKPGGPPPKPGAPPAPPPPAKAIPRGPKGGVALFAPKVRSRLMDARGKAGSRAASAGPPKPPGYPPPKEEEKQNANDDGDDDDDESWGKWSDKEWSDKEWEEWNDKKWDNWKSWSKDGDDEEDEEDEDEDDEKEEGPTWTDEEWKKWKEDKLAEERAELRREALAKRQQEKEEREKKEKEAAKEEDREYTAAEWKAWERSLPKKDQDRLRKGRSKGGKGLKVIKGAIKGHIKGTKLGKGKGKKDVSDEEGDGKRKVKAKRKGKGKGDDEPEKFGDTWEQHRSESGLKLIGDLAPKHVKWNYVVKDESRRCFAGYLPNPFSKAQCDKWFENVKNGTDWKQPMGHNGPVPRKTAWMVKRGCKCCYRYGGLEVEPQDFPVWMMEILRTAMPLCGLSSPSAWPDSCNLNLYEDGGMSVGWHSDDERLFQGQFTDISIISLSFGQERKFELRRNWPEKGEKSEVKVSLSGGDLMTMEGMTQKHYQHRVPRENIKGASARINLTWRWVLKHYAECPVARTRS